MKLKHHFISTWLPVIFLLPFVIISFYNHPALDDWWYAEVYKQYGLTGAQQYWYNNYTARFFSNFIMTVAPLSFGWIEGAKVMPIIFLIMLYGTFTYIHKVFLKGFTSRSYLLPLWFTAGYLLIQRDYFEGIYWLSANVVYQYTMLFWMLHLTLLYKIYFQNENKVLYYALALLCSIAATASNETLGGLILVETLAISAFAFYTKQRKTLSLVLLSGVIISWLIMFAARGNWTKIEGATKEHIYTFYFLKAVKYSIISSGYYGVFLLKQLSVWCIIFLSLPVWKYLFHDKLGLNKKRNYLVASAICCMVVFAIYFIAIYPTGILISPLRVTNIAIVFLFAGISLAVLWLSEKFNWLSHLAIYLNRNRTLVMIACITFAATTPTQYRKLLHDLTSGKAKEYNIQMYLRYDKIKAETRDTCYVPQLKDVPRSIVASDVSGPVGENIGLIFGKSFKVKIVE